ncbi:MAG: protein kinase [Planctomycetales bacterium]|nr:protein kinase [Planctomycetales bacterium]
MSENQVTCDDAALDALLRRDQSLEPSEEFLAHIENCTRCQARISELAGSTAMWHGVKAAISGGGCSGQQHRYSPVNLDQSAIQWTESMAKQLLSPPTHPEMLGRLGRYEVERLIGSGGMGVVFKAFDTELNRPVAIKLLAPYLASSGPARKRFAREARAAAAVVHQHVVPIHNVETERESPFIVMQYVSGESLQARIYREGPLELCEILRIGMQVADGLSAAHQQGLVHRDIKPSNILLEEDVDRALISDFGLARATDDASLTRTGYHPGTPQYMSPEQASGQSVDASSDLFSLGSMLYTMCTGRPPFRAENSLSVMRRITETEATPIREINPNIPQWLCTLVMKLMAKKPKDRLQSAGVVRDLLGECLSHVQRPSSSLPALLVTSERSRYSLPVLISMGVSAMAVLVLILLFQNAVLQVTPLEQPASSEITREATNAALANLVKGNPLVVRAAVETGQFTGAMNLHRVQVTQSYKGNADDVRAVYAHVTKADSEPRGSIDPVEPRMPSLAPGEYVMVLEANPVTSSFAISSFGFRVTPEPTFNYVVVRESEQHAAWPVGSPEAQAIIAFCGSVGVNSQGSSEEEKIARTRIDIQTIDTACQTYKLSVGSYPDSLQDLRRKPDGVTESQWGGPYLEPGKPKLLDPWGHPIGLRVDEDGKLTVFSFGPDGKAGTADDIDNRSTTATTGNAAPLNQNGLELAVSNYSKQDETHSWSLTGKAITQVAVRLHYIVDGKSVVASESMINTGNAPHPLEKMNVTLQMKRADGNVIPKLDISTENRGPMLSQQDESVLLPQGLAAKNSAEFAVRDGSFAVESDRPFVLYRGVYFSDQDFSFDDNGLDAIVEISRTGVTFFVVTLQRLPGNVLPETGQAGGNHASSSRPLLSWQDLLGKDAPPNYPTEPLSLISALNNSRGEWVLAGTIKEGDAESVFEAAVDIQGGFKNMIRQDSFPQWQVVIAWPREEPANALVFNVMGGPEPNGIKWLLAPQHSSKAGGTVGGQHKMYEGSWNPENNTITWTSVEMRLPSKRKEAARNPPTPEQPKSSFDMVVKANGEIQFTGYQHNESLSFSGKMAARVGEPFVEKKPAITKLPGDYNIFFASRTEVYLDSQSGPQVAGPRVEKIGCEGNLIFGLTSLYANSKEDSDTLGYFWLDTSTGEIVKGLQLSAWKEALKLKGVSEPRLVGPEEVGGN